MKFILRMARREIRSSWRRLLFFFLCIASRRSIVACLDDPNVNARSRRIRQLLTQHPVASTRPWKPESLAVIDGSRAPPCRSEVETIEAPMRSAFVS